MAATTETAVRDLCVAVIAALTPTELPRDRFTPFRNEGDGSLTDWAENSPTAAFRRFQVRTLGNTAPPTVSNTDIESVEVNFVISVAYPQNHRAGQSALVRDTIMEQDRIQIERATGMTGRANFPDACWLSSTVTRAAGSACDYLVINQTMQMIRSFT